MRAPSANCGAVAAAAPCLVLGDVQLNELVAENGGAVDGCADVRRDPYAAVEGECHLRLAPVERDRAHRADRDVGHLYLGSVGEIPHVREDGGRRTLAPATRDRTSGEREDERDEERHDGQTARPTGRKPASEPPLHVVHPSRQEAPPGVPVPPTALALGQRRQQRGGRGGQRRGRLGGRDGDGHCRRRLVRSMRHLVRQQTAEPRAARDPEPEPELEPDPPGQPRTAPSRPHGVVVVVVGGGAVVVVVVEPAAGLFWAGAAGAGAAGVALAPCSALAIWVRPCCNSDWAVAAPLPPLKVLRMVGMSLRSGSKNPDDGSPHWFRVASTAAVRPVEWLATMRRQIPASRSRRRPAMYAPVTPGAAARFRSSQL